MKNMTLKEIAVACGGIYYGDEEKIGGREYLVFHVCGGELKI